MTQTVLSAQFILESLDPGAERLGGGCQTVEQQSPRFGQIALLKRVQEGRQRSSELRRFACAVHLGRRQADGRPNDDKMQHPEAGDRFDAFATSSTDGRTVAEEKRHIATQRRGDLGQTDTRPTQSPAFVGGDQGGCRVAGTTTQSPRRLEFA